MSSRIAVIGTGYVGLTTGACLSSLGHDVVCADIVPEKVEQLSRGEVPILEAGLDELVREGLQSGDLLLRARGRGRGQDRRVHLPVRAHAPGRRRFGRPQLHRGGRPGDRPVPAARGDRHQQVDRARRLHPGGRAGARALRRVRGVEPRVPPRGLGRPRLPAPRSGRDRLGGPGRRHPRRRAVPRPRRTAPGHRPRLGGDHQVRAATPSSPPRSASSTPSRRCARRSAPT